MEFSKVGSHKEEEMVSFEIQDIFGKGEAGGGRVSPISAQDLALRYAGITSAKLKKELTTELTGKGSAKVEELLAYEVWNTAIKQAEIGTWIPLKRQIMDVAAGYLEEEDKNTDKFRLGMSLAFMVASLPNTNVVVSDL